MATPDITGFREAQQRLRTLFAEPVTFIWPSEDTYPPGTVMDPETGKPMDPLVQPTSSTPHTLAVQANVAVRTGTRENVTETAVGNFEGGDILVIQSPAAGAASEGATELEARGERFRIRQTTYDGIAGVDRHLTFGERL